jgi:hypothetical protein
MPHYILLSSHLIDRPGGKLARFPEPKIPAAIFKIEDDQQQMEVGPLIAMHAAGKADRRFGQPSKLQFRLLPGHGLRLPDGARETVHIRMNLETII